jgi:hypothetical protein
MDHNQAMRMIMLLAASVLCAQDAQDDPSDVLVRAREKLLAGTNALSKYTCVQTIDRSYFVRSEASLRPSCDQISATRKKQFRSVPQVFGYYGVQRNRNRVGVGTSADRP